MSLREVQEEQDDADPRSLRSDRPVFGFGSAVQRRSEVPWPSRFANSVMSFVVSGSRGFGVLRACLLVGASR